MTTYFENKHLNESSGFNNHEDCKSYRENNKKKDELIQQLCRIHPGQGPEVNNFRPIHNCLQNEVPALQVKIDSLEDRLRQKQSEIDGKNEKIAILKKEGEIHKLEAEKFDSENRKLLTLNRELNASVETYESLKYRSEYTIKCLQEQFRQSQSNVADAEARIRNHVMDRENTDKVKCSLESKYQKFLMCVSNLVSVNDHEETDTILSKLSDIAEQNALLNGRLHSMEEKVKISDNDARDARETIIKLMKDYEGVGQGREDLKETKNRLTAENTDLNSQINLLTKRIESLQSLYNSSKSMCEDKTNQIINMELRFKEQHYATKSSETMLTSLLESLAAMLGTPFAPCAAIESAIKDKVKQMVQKLKEQTSAAEMLDQRVLMLQKQFESQYETGKELMGRANNSDQARQELINKIKSLEDDVSAQSILRDNLKCEHERVSRNITKLADLLQVEYLPSDTDSLGLLDLLQERCQEILLDNNGFNCQRCSKKSQMPDSQKQAKRITALKEELEAKNLQIQLLEKRLNQDGFRPDTCQFGNETNRDKVYRLQHQVEESQIEIEQLRRALVRSQSADYDIHKQQKQQQREEIEQLTETIEKLDKTRQKQAKKISAMKVQIEDKEHKLIHSSKSGGDLKEARQLLEEIRRREIQLLNFRASIAEALGVDLRCSHDPESEIEAKIHTLLNVAQTAVETPFSPYYLNQNMGPHFQQGYSNPNLGYTACQPSSLSCTQNIRSSTVSFEESGQKLAKRAQIPKNKIVFSNVASKHDRTRSTSPSKRDERKY